MANFCNFIDISHLQYHFYYLLMALRPLLPLLYERNRFKTLEERPKQSNAMTKKTKQKKNYVIMFPKNIITFNVTVWFKLLRMTLYFKRLSNVWSKS